MAQLNYVLRKLTMPVLAQSEALRDITATRGFFTGGCELHEGPPKSSQTRAEESKTNTLT